MKSIQHRLLEERKRETKRKREKKKDHVGRKETCNPGKERERERKNSARDCLLIKYQAQIHR